MKTTFTLLIDNADIKTLYKLLEVNGIFFSKTMLDTTIRSICYESFNNGLITK